MREAGDGGLVLDGNLTLLQATGGGARHLLAHGLHGHGDDAAAALDDALAALRRRTSLDALAPLDRGLGLDHGFRLDDAVSVTLRPAHAGDGERLAARLRRVLPPDCALELAPPAPDRILTLDALLRERDNLRRRAPYQRRGARLHVEAFELHVVEHCNLRCAHCCNMSPYLDQRFLSVNDVAQQCTMMARHLDVDVFKIMGGEPLLHPDITGVLRAIRASQISPIIRLFTNGLLLHRMDDAFWQALDQLTISSYSSAPVKQSLLDEHVAKARRFDVIVNVKPVSSFSQVMAPARRHDEALVQATYDACWLRDRCLIVRDGRFFKCTRAAYFAEFQQRIAVADPHPDPAAVVRADGVAVDAPELDARLLDYMNDPRPLESCRYCQGSSGALVPHTQLTRALIESGHL